MPHPRAQTRLPRPLTFYAHTAQLPDGSPDPDESHWQPLHTTDPARPDHLDSVAAGSAAPFDSI